jgi:type VI secretion system protein
MAGEVQQNRFAFGQSRPVFHALAMVLALALAGCKTPSFLCLKTSGLDAITINSSPETNAGRPIAVDLVFITDKTVWQSMSKLKARDYFAAREQLRRDFPKGYRAISWELQAGQYVTQTATSAPCNLIGTLIFADYASEGEHRMALRNVKGGTLVLGADDFTWFAKKDG